MRTIRTLGLAAVAALSLGIGSAMAQEGPRATESGATYFGPGYQSPSSVQAPAARQGVIQSGSSDPETVAPVGRHYYWTPGVPYGNQAGEN